MISAGAAAVTAGVMGLYVHQDGLLDCGDGARYTSRIQQPYPFHRRFCGWPKITLQFLTLGCLFYLGVMMGGWQKAALLMTLPGAWFITTHPTTVDAPSMLLAWLSSSFIHDHPPLAIGLSLLAGFVHERGPVFAALYAWSPWPLLGLLAVGWWRRPAQEDGDPYAGRGLLASIRSHSPYIDLLDWRVNLFALRGLPLLGAWYGLPISAWATLAVANGSRIVGTDGARFLFWASPALLAPLPDDIPAWVIAIHAISFRRMI